MKGLRLEDVLVNGDPDCSERMGYLSSSSIRCQVRKPFGPLLLTAAHSLRSCVLLSDGRTESRAIRRSTQPTLRARGLNNTRVRAPNAPCHVTRVDTSTGRLGSEEQDCAHTRS